MPFCPCCKAEYQNAFSECGDCEVKLVAQLKDPGIELDMGDVYICYEPFQANRIAEMLRALGIETLVRDRSCSAFPTNLGTTCEQHIAVLPDHFDEAHRVIEAAIDDRVISGDGHLL
tara:strand:- start:279 stop:629 length:351 start_codon:yes stop_codon:yes gene_type:complete